MWHFGLHGQWHVSERTLGSTCLHCTQVQVSLHFCCFSDVKELEGSLSFNTINKWLFAPCFLCNHANTFSIFSAFEEMLMWAIRNMAQMVNVSYHLSVIVSVPFWRPSLKKFIWITLTSKLSFAEIQKNKTQFCLLILVLKSEQFPMTLFPLATPEIIFSLQGCQGRCLEIAAPSNGTCREKMF